MTGSPIQTGFRHICPNTEAPFETSQIAASCASEQVSASFHGTKQLSKRKQMYFSDDSICYETTASQDERIGQKLQEEKEEEQSQEELTERERKEYFQDAFHEQSNEIFHLPGLTYLKFTHEKIKFCFEPCEVATLVRQGVKFYCSLKYLKKFQRWKIRRDSFPVNYKSRIYTIFYAGESFSITDENIADTILRVYIKLKLWAKEEQEFRQEKFLKYQNGEDVKLDSDDEQLFLTPEERIELKRKRDAVLKRMIPPSDVDFQLLSPERPKRNRKQVFTKKRKHQRRISSTTDSD